MGNLPRLFHGEQQRKELMKFPCIGLNKFKYSFYTSIMYYSYMYSGRLHAPDAFEETCVNYYKSLDPSW